MLYDFHNCRQKGCRGKCYIPQPKISVSIIHVGFIWLYCSYVAVYNIFPYSIIVQFLFSKWDHWVHSDSLENLVLLILKLNTKIHILTLNMSVTTAADNSFHFFFFFRENKLTFHVNCLPSRWFIWNVYACFLWKIKNKKNKFLECHLLQILLRALGVKWFDALKLDWKVKYLYQDSYLNWFNVTRYQPPIGFDTVEQIDRYVTHEEMDGKQIWLIQTPVDVSSSHINGYRL